MTTELRAHDLKRAVGASLDALRERRAAIDSLNVYPVPDADTGTNLVMTFEAVVTALERAGGADHEIAHAVRSGSLMGARGNSGVICAQILHAWSDAVEDGPAGPERVAGSFDRAVELAYEAVLEPAEGTILTVARAAAGATHGRHAGVGEQFAAAAAAAAEALSHTPEQLRVLAEAGVVDAGGLGLVVVLESFARALGTDVRVAEVEVAAPPMGFDALCDGAAGGYAYEVQYMLSTRDDSIPPLRQLLGTIGDSVVVVGGNESWRVHVHTDARERAVGLGEVVGRVSGIEVVSFADQARAAATRAPARAPGQRGIALARTTAPLSLVAIASGPGVARLLSELGAIVLEDRHPSAGEIERAILSAPCEDVVLLPNDDDLYASAAALAERVPKRLTVLRTSDQAQGLAVAVAYGDARGAAENLSDMNAVLARVRTGGVALAREPIDTPKGPAAVGQAVGFAEGAMVAVGDDPVAAALAVAEHLLAGGGSVVTVLAGGGTPPGEPARLREAVRSLRSGIAVETHDGGQPTHRYLIAVE